MAETVVIVYERGSDMNLDYYLNKHVPMVFGFWQPYAKYWRASAPGPESASPYELMISVEMDNTGDFAKALATLSKEQEAAISEDLTNYSKKPPVIWTQDLKGGSA
ncbi:hypothetical protein BJ170DRAFT_597823 [Xylariales sp. AK1849]|nr:hypothetical protein BJ170DRAFT_597823 [Xylariales sp. AK1849]